VIRRTPVVAAGLRVGERVLLKLENLQRTGSFKLRGATAAVAALSAAERSAGVVTASAGNHGAGLALACAEAGVRCTVVVGTSAPAVKRAAIAALGAELLVEGADYDEADLVAKDLARARGARHVPPFDDDVVIAGNGGALARELREQVPDLARVILPIGGGGMAAGLSAKLAPRGITVVGAQPEANCAMHDSIAQGRALTDYRGGPTIADALAGAICERTHAICARHLDSIALVSEEAIARAVAYLYREIGTIAEPGGAAALAALLDAKATAAPAGTTAVIISGANIDGDLLDRILSETEA
jgi:threonine dehydratase